MKSKPRTLLLLSGISLLGGLAAVGLAPVGVDAAPAPSPGAAMADAAGKLLATLSPDQRKKASFGLEDNHRVDWYFIPKARLGLVMKEMTPPQRQATHALLKVALSQTGYQKTTQIMELEKVLAEIEKDPVKRDPELYYVSVFGTPDAKGTWGFRFEGHHLSMNVTVVKGTMIATTPLFFGTNPAEVRVDGPYKGRRVLRQEEDLARQLVTSLDEGQRKQAVFSDKAPPDVVTSNASKVEPLAPAGIAASALNPQQAATLRKLIQEYAASMPAPLAKERLARLEKGGFAKVTFAWAGGLKPGDGHYYRVQGPTALLEYDNTQNGANHVHAVWRDFDGDFGRDLLREHLKAAHGK